MNTLAATNTAFQDQPATWVANPTETLGEVTWALASQDAEPSPWTPLLTSDSEVLSAWLLARSGPWSQPLASKLQELATLPEGWDGYNGKPVCPAIVRCAAQLVDQLYVPGLIKPHLVPGGDDTLQLEWHVNQFDLEIDILGPRQLVAYLYDLDGGKEEEMEMEPSNRALAGWVRRVQQRGSAARQTEG